jgi:hypothetical protein
MNTQLPPGLAVSRFMKRRTPRPHHGPVVIAIPVRDEEERIGSCLAALTDQIDAQADHIVLLVNNTSDGTVEAARRVAMPPGTTLHIVERTLPPEQANAGQARRLAMQEAYRLAGGSGILLTTDADSQADPDWLAANLAAIAEGADAVAGWVDLDPADWSNIPLSLHEDDARECAYDALCDEIHARLDPDPFDPLPRHTQNSGASIAVTAAAYRAAGGIPAVPSGEDRAFLAALRRQDVGIRHSLACHVTVSGRIVGRAAGGMADTIRRRLQAPDPHLDLRLEPAADCARRAALRRRFRQLYDDPARLEDIAAAVGLEQALLRDLLASKTFGVAWDDLEQASPVLRRRPVAVADLPAQMASAQRICAALRRFSVGDEEIEAILGGAL